MLTVDFYYNHKTSRYIGWTVYNNGTYYASGDSLDTLIKNMKTVVCYKGKIYEPMELASKPVESLDQVPMRVFNHMFIAKYINPTLRRTKPAKRKYTFKTPNTGLVELDRQTLEKNLTKMAQGENTEDKAPKLTPDEPKEKSGVRTGQFSYRVSEGENGKILTVYELVEVGKWPISVEPNI